VKDLSCLVIDMEAKDRLRKISAVRCKIIMAPEIVMNTDSTACASTPRCKIKLSGESCHWLAYVYWYVLPSIEGKTYESFVYISRYFVQLLAFGGSIGDLGLGCVSGIKKHCVKNCKLV